MRQLQRLPLRLLIVALVVVVVVVVVDEEMRKRLRLNAFSIVYVAA